MFFILIYYIDSHGKSQEGEQFFASFPKETMENSEK